MEIAVANVHEIVTLGFISNFNTLFLVPFTFLKEKQVPSAYPQNLTC